jgi:hypothetical protein
MPQSLLTIPSESSLAPNLRQLTSRHQHGVDAAYTSPATRGCVALRQGFGRIGSHSGGKTTAAAVAKPECRDDVLAGPQFMRSAASNSMAVRTAR